MPAFSFPDFGLAEGPFPERTLARGAHRTAIECGQECRFFFEGQARSFDDADLVRLPAAPCRCAATQHGQVGGGPSTHCLARRVNLNMPPHIRVSSERAFSLIFEIGQIAELPYSGRRKWPGTDECWTIKASPRVWRGTDELLLVSVRHLRSCAESRVPKPEHQMVFTDVRKSHKRPANNKEYLLVTTRRAMISKKRRGDSR